MKKILVVTIIILSFCLIGTGCVVHRTIIQDDTTVPEGDPADEFIDYSEDYKRQYETEYCFKDFFLPEKYILVTDTAIVVITNLVSEQIKYIPFISISSYKCDELLWQVTIYERSLAKPTIFNLSPEDYEVFNKVKK